MTEIAPVLPHGPLEPIVPGVWQVRGSLPYPLARMMTVVRLSSGGLLIHSAVALDEAGMQSLEALGKPEVLVVPHPMHLRDTPFFKARYPELPVVAPDDARARLAGRVKVEAHPRDLLPELGVVVHEAPGMKYSEVVLEFGLETGRALVFTDLFSTPGKGLMMKLLGAPGGMGLSRIVKLRQVSDRAAIRDFFEARGETPALELILSAHGAPVRVDCSTVLRESARRV